MIAKAAVGGAEDVKDIHKEIKVMAFTLEGEVFYKAKVRV